MLRLGKDGKPEVNEVFAADLKLPFGIAFYPKGPDPKYIYIGNTDSIIRYPYKNGDIKATGKAGGPRSRHSRIWPAHRRWSLDARCGILCGRQENACLCWIAFECF